MSTINVKWPDGTEAEVVPPPSWIEWIIDHATLHGFSVCPLEDKPHYMACVPAERLRKLAREELEALRNIGGNI